MKLNLLSSLAVALFGLASVSNAQNSVINMTPGGSPSSSGIILYDGDNNQTNNFSSAVTIDVWVNNIVSNSIGDFSGIPANSAVTYFDGWVIGSAQANLWQVGGVTFDLNHVTKFIQDEFFINVFGEGVLNGPGFSNTPATWNFSTQGVGSPYASWTSSTTTVPDGGTTFALLGCALLGLHGFRRKFASNRR